MNIVCFSGKAQHGKSTCAEILKEQLEKNGFRVVIANYGGLVKYICKEFFGWDGVKDETGRSILQYVGTDIVRERNPDYWVRFIDSIAKLFYDHWDYMIIDDARFPNELSGLKDHDVIHARVIRPMFENSLTAEQRRHPSETSLDNSKPDVNIVNSGSMKNLAEEIYRKLTVEIICKDQLVIPGFEKP